MGSCCCREKDHHYYGGDNYGSFGDGEMAAYEDSDRDSTNAYERGSYEDSDRDSTNAYERDSYDEDSDRDSTHPYERDSPEDSDRDSIRAYERDSCEGTDKDSANAYERATDEDSYRNPTHTYERDSYEDSYRNPTHAYERDSYEATDRDQSTDEMADSADGVETSGRIPTDRAASCPVDVTQVVAGALQSQGEREVKRAKAAVSKIRFRIVGTETTHFKLTLGLGASRFDGLVERFCKRYCLDDDYKESLLDGKYSDLNENFVEKFYFTVNEMGGVVSGVFVSRKVTEETYDVACAVYSVKLKVTEQSLTLDQEECLKIYFTDKARRALFVQYPALK